MNKDVNFFGNSYGGYWVATTAQYFVQQNEKIAKGAIKGSSIKVANVLWTNGSVDEAIHAEWYPQQAYNNTYGLQVIPKDVYEQSLNDFTKSGGCYDLIQDCRKLGDMYDPDNLAINQTVNKICEDALGYCATKLILPYNHFSNRSAMDMAHLNPDPYPTNYWIGYFNQPWVQKALGVPVNLTGNSNLVSNIFTGITGDAVRIAGVKSIEYLLANGVKIDMMYGDRDYRCPWNGGEKLSLAAQWPGSAKFSSAGYEYVQTNSSYQGGMVRQYGKLAFVRVFEAGHDGKALLAFA